MTPEHLDSVQIKLNNNPETIRAVIVCTDDSVEMIGNEFCAEMVSGQLQRMIFEMQFQAMVDDDPDLDEPEYLTEKIHSDLNNLAIGH